MLTQEIREDIVYMLGKIDGLTDSGCGYDGEEIKKIFGPFRSKLSEILRKDDESNEIPD